MVFILLPLISVTTFFSGYQKQDWEIVADSGKKFREIHRAGEKAGFQASGLLIRLLAVADKF